MSNAAEWLRKTGKGATVGEFGARVADLLEEWKFGIYHLHSPHHKRTDWSQESYIEIVEYAGLSTFDNATLTRLVLLAHKHRIRVDVSGAAYRYLLICFSKRVNSPDNIYNHHPDIQEMLERQKDIVKGEII